MPSNVEIVQQMWSGRFTRPNPVEITSLFEDTVVLDANRRWLAPDAKVEFATPDGGFLGAMGGPFAGPGGLIDAWREWVEPWDSYAIRIEEWTEPRPAWS